MKTHVDASVYPDESPPVDLVTEQQKADYVHRLLSAFDFGIPPDAVTLRLLSNWRDVFDNYPLPASAGYHALRAYFGWPAVERAPFPNEPAYLAQDAFEGRGDGCEHCV